MQSHISRPLRASVLGALLLAACFSILVCAPLNAQSPEDDPFCAVSSYCNEIYNPLPPSEGDMADLPFAPATSEESDDWWLATWSRLAGSALVDNNWELWVANGDNSGGHLIATHPGNDITPRLAPGAQQIVFVSDRGTQHLPADQRVYRLYTVNVDGSNVRQLLDLPFSQHDPVWSPDGTQILFHMEVDGNRDLYRVNADGSALTRITTHPAADLQPTWSRVSNKIAWVRRTSDTTGSLMMAESDGSGESVLYADMPWLERPVFSPSGDRIAFTGRYAPDQLTNNQALVLLLAPGSTPWSVRDCTPASWCRIGGWSEGMASWWSGSLNEAYTLMVNQLYYKQLNLQELDYIHTFNFFGWGGLLNAFFPEHAEVGHHGAGVETDAPVFSASAPPPYARGGVHVPFFAEDVGPSGIKFGEYEVASDGASPPWKQVYIFHSTNGLATGTGKPGTPQRIRFRFLDYAGNVSPFSEWFRYTMYHMDGYVGITDNRGVPLEGATATGGRYGFGISPANSNGTIHYHTLNPQQEERFYRQIEMVDAGSAGAAAPLDFAPINEVIWGTYAENLDFTLKPHIRTYLAPESANPVVNGDFEASTSGGLASGWLQEGATREKNFFDEAPTWNMWVRDSLKQTIPAEGWATMHAPTLSFLYVLASGDSNTYYQDIFARPEGDGQRFEVAVVDMTTFTRTVVFTDIVMSALPEVGWANLAPWQGRSIRIEFSMHDRPEYPFAKSVVLLDRVKIAPWTTPVITALALGTETDAAVALAPTRYRLTVNNLLGTPKVTVGGVEVTVARVDDSTIEVDTAGVPPGSHRVCAIHASGMYSCAVENVQVGNGVWLPIVQ